MPYHHLPSFNLPFIIWMLTGFFEEIPLEIEESAKLDGCSAWQIFWKIIMPLSKCQIFYPTTMFLHKGNLGGPIILRVNVETHKMHIDRLKHLIADCPSGIDAPEEIKHILETAPQTLRQAENAIQTSNPALLEELNEALKRTEVFVTWATARIKGQATAQAIMNGREADPLFPVEDRLLNRILKFSLTIVDGPTYLLLVKEFAGNKAVYGNTVHMDPTRETEAFSQWLVHDICLPSQQKRLIDIFAEKHSAELPDDEKTLLKLRQADRPSIYKVVDLSGDHEAPGIYLIQDLLLTNDSLRIWDIP